jgi:hypothetical protein
MAASFAGMVNGFCVKDGTFSFYLCLRGAQIGILLSVVPNKE